MRTIRQAVLVLLVASLCALACAPAASASRLSVNEETWRATFSSLTAEGSSITVTCPFTLQGEFDPVFTKTTGGIIGAVYDSEVNSAGCRGGAASVLHETLPTESTYVSFTGTLPRITSFTFAFPGLSFRLEALGIACLYRSTSASPAEFAVNVNERGEASSLRAIESVSIPLATGSGLCPTSIRLSGTGTITTLATGGTYRVTLVEAAAAIPHLRVNPRVAAVPPLTEISIPVRITNRENVDIRTERVEIITNTFFEIFADECENITLRAREANECEISTLYKGTELERVKLAKFRIRYTFNGGAQSQKILTIARRP